MELNVEGWKEFCIGNIFQTNIAKSLDYGNTEKGNNVFVGRTSNNNGVQGYVAEEPVEKGNCIIIGMVGENWAFYQSKPFVASQNIFVLRNEYLNNTNAMFLCSVLNKCVEIYRETYSLPLSKEKMNKRIIKLPIKQNTNKCPIIDKNKTYSNEGYIPDWQFMEEYIKSLHHKPIVTKVKPGNTKELDNHNWKEFKVSRIFTLLNGKGITKDEIEENRGTFIAVQSGEENNGVLGKIDKQYCIKMGYTITDKMCLTVARTGSAGFVSFQSDGCVVGDSAKILLLDDNIATTNIYLFLQTILTANRFKYDYGRKVTEDKYLADIIKLPIKMDNNRNPIIDNNCIYSDNGYIPDWQFMESYINSLPYSDRI